MDVLDPEALQALRALEDDGNDDLLGELIDLFLVDAPARIAAMRDALAREDWAALAARAHSLRGSCGSLGALHMADLCSWLEQHGRSGDHRSADLVFRELEGQYALVREALLRERRGPADA